jgi:hypothetical protein
MLLSVRRTRHGISIADAIPKRLYEFELLFHGGKSPLTMSPLARDFRAKAVRALVDSARLSYQGVHFAGSSEDRVGAGR